MATKTNLVGRKAEQKTLKQCIDSPKAELIAVYGRRRVGKTYLIKKYFDEKFDFYVSGIYGIETNEQLERFAYQLSTYTKTYIPKPNNWFEAFDLLKNYLKTLKKRKIVVFMDELPWFDAHKSNFLRAFEAFWNMWGATQDRLKMIVCGSSTTWIISKLFGDKGGLHNRVTRRIYLRPFTLGETEEFFKNRGFRWKRDIILQCYMALGGIPFYLDMVDPSLGLVENFDKLFFNDNSELKMEFDFMMRTLFNDSQAYKRVLAVLGSKLKGLTRQEILDELKISTNGTLTEILENLCNCDFVRSYAAIGKSQRDTIYQLTDMFTLFYLRFMAGNKSQNPHFWSSLKDQTRASWQGYAFEQVCLRHIDQIKSALGISGVQCNVCSWSKKADAKSRGAQIDLLIERPEGYIYVCEMKYSDKKFRIDDDYMAHIESRIESLDEQLSKKSNYTFYPTMITAKGLADNENASMIRCNVVADDLFEKGR